MLALFYRSLRELGRSRTATLGLVLSALAPVTFPNWQPLAQRPPTVTSFRHANTLKAIESLDWIGLFDQLQPYPLWWKETAACAAIPLPASRAESVQFYYVNAPDFAPIPTDKTNRMVAGVTYAASEQIYLSVLRLREETAVKHEMLHQLLYWWGENDWDDDARPEFKRCGLQTLA